MMANRGQSKPTRLVLIDVFIGIEQDKKLKNKNGLISISMLNLMMPDIIL